MAFAFPIVAFQIELAHFTIFRDRCYNPVCLDFKLLSIYLADLLICLLFGLLSRLSRRKQLAKSFKICLEMDR